MSRFTWRACVVDEDGRVDLRSPYWAMSATLIVIVAIAVPCDVSGDRLVAGSW